MSDGSLLPFGYWQQRYSVYKWHWPLQRGRTNVTDMHLSARATSWTTWTWRRLHLLKQPLQSHKSSPVDLHVEKLVCSLGSHTCSTSSGIFVCSSAPQGHTRSQRVGVHPNNGNIQGFDWTCGYITRSKRASLLLRSSVSAQPVEGHKCQNVNSPALT